MEPSDLGQPRPEAQATPKLRILYADDFPELRELIAFSLTRSGHSVACAEDGLKAWAAISPNPAAYDLVITDHDMPQMSGLELVEKLRSLPFAGKVIVFSGELTRDAIERYRALAPDLILGKPVMPAALEQSIDNLFGTASATRAAAT